MCIYIHIYMCVFTYIYKYIYIYIYIYRVILQNDAHLRHGKTELLISFKQNRGKKNLDVVKIPIIIMMIVQCHVRLPGGEPLKTQLLRSRTIKKMSKQVYMQPKMRSFI